MGKTRKAVWGLLLATAALLVGLTRYGAHVTREGAPSPAPTEAAGALAGVSICVDAGHGGYDGGARARDSGAWEKELNLDVSLRLARALRAQGAAVVLTREGDDALAGAGENRKRRDLQARVDAARGVGAFISIHMNEYRDRGQSGPQVFYRRGAAEGRLLAGAIQEALNGSLAPPRARQANTGQYYVLENLDIPAVLVECGFLSNAAEEKALLDAAYRQRVADAVCAGILTYFELISGR